MDPTGPYRLPSHTDAIIPRRGQLLLFCRQLVLNRGSIVAEHLSRWALPDPRLLRLPGEGLQLRIKKLQAANPLTIS